MKLFGLRLCSEVRHGLTAYCECQLSTVQFNTINTVQYDVIVTVQHDTSHTVQNRQRNTTSSQVSHEFMCAVSLRIVTEAHRKHKLH